MGRQSCSHWPRLLLNLMMRLNLSSDSIKIKESQKIIARSESCEILASRMSYARSSTRRLASLHEVAPPRPQARPTSPAQPSVPSFNITEPNSAYLAHQPNPRKCSACSLHIHKHTFNRTTTTHHINHHHCPPRHCATPLHPLSLHATPMSSPRAHSSNKTQ